jgi:hypothetical protein
MDSTLEILRRLTNEHVEFVVVGGLAGVAHGSSLVTEDLDVCAPLSRSNVERILSALQGLNPRWRMSPDRPPLSGDADRLKGLKNIYLVTDLGQIDFLSEITGVGDYGAVARRTIEVDLAGVTCRVLDIDALIESKRALARPKDLRAALELEAIRRKIRGG